MYEKEIEKYRKTPEFAAHQARVQEEKLKDAKKSFRKDENAPKRSQSAYFIWMNEVGRPAFTKANPDADIGTVGKALGEQWKSMSEEDKQTFKDKAEKAKKKYEIAVEKYRKTAEYRNYEAAKQAFKEEQSSKRKRLESKMSLGVQKRPRPRSAPRAEARPARP